MCGIAGSTDRKLSFKLYEANLARGRYSAGMLAIDGGNGCVIKSPKPFELEDIPPCKDLYLFHSRAPTSRTIEYRPEDTHPFRVDSVYVAHNGIITNAEALAEKYQINYSLPGASLVDSYVIPYIINANKKMDRSWDQAITKTLSELEGTFGLWIHIRLETLTYVCRSGSTLYLDKKGGSFSSSPYEDFTMAKDGVLYRIHSEPPPVIVDVGNFAVKPIYFIA